MFSVSGKQRKSKTVSMTVKVREEDSEKTMLHNWLVKQMEASDY